MRLVVSCLELVSHVFVEFLVSNIMIVKLDVPGIRHPVVGCPVAKAEK